MFNDLPDGQTHYADCWRDPAHHACAVAKIERLERERDEAVTSLRDLLRAIDNIYLRLQYSHRENKRLKVDDRSMIQELDFIIAEAIEPAERLAAALSAAPGTDGGGESDAV